MTRLPVPERGWEHAVSFVARWTGWTIGEIMGLSPYQLEQVMAGLTRTILEENGQQDSETKEALEKHKADESSRKVAEVLKGRKGKITLAELMQMDPNPGG